MDSIDIINDALDYMTRNMDAQGREVAQKARECLAEIEALLRAEKPEEIDADWQDNECHDEPAPKPEGRTCEVKIGSLWNYDRSLDHAVWKPPLKVIEVYEKSAIFDQPMPYNTYGLEYFGRGAGFSFTPYAPAASDGKGEI